MAAWGELWSGWVFLVVISFIVSIGFSIRTPGWPEVWLYSNLSHRSRCVWKLCVVDNPRDLKLLSVKEQRAQKLLRKVFHLNKWLILRSEARAGLNKSKLNRLGGRVHEGYILPDGKALTGGEKFPTMLRSIVSSTTLKMETHELKERRDKVSPNFLPNITSFRKKISQVTSRSYIEAVIWKKSRNLRTVQSVLLPQQGLEEITFNLRRTCEIQWAQSSIPVERAGSWSPTLLFTSSKPRVQESGS